MWTLETALPVVRAIESALKDHGCHCCLGGSVLHSGQSSKDLDVFIYPHAWKQAPQHGLIGYVIGKLSGFSGFDGDGLTESKDKTVWSVTFEGRRIDLFFLLPSALPASPFHVS
jgi:hypothetical protein